MHLNGSVGEDSWESLGLQGHPTSPSWRKSVLNIHWKDWCWSWNSNIWPSDAKNWLLGKDPDAGKDWRREEKEMTEDETVGWHHWLIGHEFEQPGMLQSTGSQKVRYDWATELMTSLISLGLSDFPQILLNFKKLKHMDSSKCCTENTHIPTV